MIRWYSRVVVIILVVLPSYYQMALLLAPSSCRLPPICWCRAMFDSRPVASLYSSISSPTALPLPITLTAVTSPALVASPLASRSASPNCCHQHPDCGDGRVLGPSSIRNACAVTRPAESRSRGRYPLWRPLSAPSQAGKLAGRYSAVPLCGRPMSVWYLITRHMFHLHDVDRS